jgi:hypothetical protein
VLLTGSGTINDTTGIPRPAGWLVVTTAFPSSFSGSNGVFPYAQGIEGFNAYDLIGKQVTVSFLVRGTTPGVYAVSLRDSSGVLSCVKTFSLATANVTQFVSLTFPAVPSSAVIPVSTALGMWLNIGAVTGPSLQTPTKDSWQAGNYVSSSDATNWLTTINNALNLTDIQLEAGSVATPFERRSYGQELELCQRYYEAGQNALAVLWAGNATSGSAYFSMTRFGVQKRATPTITYSSQAYSGFTSIAVGANVTVDGFQTTATATSTVVGGYFGANFTANAEL